MGLPGHAWLCGTTYEQSLKGKEADGKNFVDQQSSRLISIRRGIFNEKAGVLTLEALSLPALAAGSTFGITYNATHSKTDVTADSHGKTRTTVRHVFGVGAPSALFAVTTLFLTNLDVP